MEQEQKKELTLKEQTEELKRKVEETAAKAREIEMIKKEKRNTLVNEMADMVEGNLKQESITRHPEYDIAYIDRVREQADIMQGLKNDIQESERIIGGLEVSDELKKDLEDLKENIQKQKDEIFALENAFKKESDEHHKHLEEQKEASKDMLEFTINQFVQASMVEEMDEEAKENLRKEVIGEVRARQRDREKERAQENTKKSIEEYSSVVEAVKKEFGTLKEKIGEKLEALANEIKNPELLADIAKKIGEIDRKRKKHNSSFPKFESTKNKLIDEIRSIEGSLMKINRGLTSGMHNVVDEVKRFRLQREHGNAWESLPGKLHTHNYNLDNDPELKTRSVEAVRQRERLLNEIKAYEASVKNQLDQYITKIETIIPPGYSYKD